MSDQQPEGNNMQDQTTAAQVTQDDLATKIEDLQKLAEENLNGWKRAKADLVNYKKEIDEEKKQWMAFALVSVVMKFLPILDHLNAALEANSGNGEADEKLKSFIVGIENTKKQFESLLRDLEIVEVAGVGAEFDPFVHESVEKEGDVTGNGKLVVAKVLTRGYKLNDQILRSAKVVVKEVQNKE